MPPGRAVDRSPRLAALWCALLLAACGGGGSSPAGAPGPGGGSSAPPGPPPWTPTAEYTRNYGLGAISASGAYVAGWSGAGVRVATIDTGIDVANPEFKGAIDPASLNIATGTSNIQDPYGHGTAVAGIIAAARDETGTHGVAPGASLLVVRADSPGSCPSSCSFTQKDLTNATAHAAAQGARVINYSLGGAAPSASFANALTAASAGAVLVASAGNSGGADPVDPALSLALAGRGIAVGAVDSRNQIAAFSNRAGSAREFYLVAPGVSVATTAIGGGVATWSGTSFAAPHVSGAAAVLLERYPFLAPAQVIDLLLRTATDLGAPGADAVYGRGLVNLQAALAPQGPLNVPTGAMVSSGGSDLAATAARLGPAFGDALAGAALLKQAIALDAYGRPYGVDLSQRVQRTIPGVAMSDWLRPGREAHRVDMALAGGAMALHFDDARASAADRDSDPERARPFSLAAALPGGYSVGMGRAYGLDALGFSSAASGLMSGPVFGSPFLAMADSGDSLAFGAPVGPLTLRFGFSGAGPDQGPAAAAPVAIRVGEIGHRWDRGAALKLQFGDMREPDGLLRSSGSGAYALGEGARTRFLGWFGTLPLSAQVELVGSYVAGLTDTIGAPGGILRDISGLRSEAFSLGLFNRRVLREDDRVGLIVSQPLRIAQGSALIDVPVARTLAGGIVRATQRADLAPSGREIDTEIEYRLLLGAQESLTLNLLLQLEPGHDANAAPSLFGGLRYRLHL